MDAREEAQRRKALQQERMSSEILLERHKQKLETGPTESEAAYIRGRIAELERNIAAIDDELGVPKKTARVKA